MKTKISKKAIMLIVAAVLLIALAVGGTVAYLQAETTPVTNTFIAGEVKCKVHEEQTDTTITSIKIEVVQNIPAYIRVAVTGNTLDDNGQYVTGNFDVDPYLNFGNDTNWEKGSDGFFYYKNAVSPSGLTEELLKTDIEKDKKLVTVLAEAIQADGMGATSAQQAFQIAKGGA